MPRQQKGKPFPWQVRRTEVERLQKIERIYLNLRNQQILAPFTKELGHSILVLLASKPFAQWPKEAKTALEWLRPQYEGSIELYLSLLPAESETAIAGTAASTDPATASTSAVSTTPATEVETSPPKGVSP